VLQDAEQNTRAEKRLM